MTTGPPAAPSVAWAGKSHKPGDLVSALGQVRWRPWRMVIFWPEGKEAMADEQWKPDGMDQMAKGCSSALLLPGDIHQGLHQGPSTLLNVGPNPPEIHQPRQLYQLPGYETSDLKPLGLVHGHNSWETGPRKIQWPRLCNGDRQNPQNGQPGWHGPYHDASEQADSLPTVGVWDHVTVADGEEGDGDEPHGTQEVAGYILLVMVPAKETQTSVSQQGTGMDVAETGVPGHRGFPGMGCAQGTGLTIQ